MDCFYAAVETKFNPSLRGKPVAVGGPPNTRSVICTANYEARKFGVKSALPSSQAVRLCPSLILVPPHFELYKEESRAIRKIFEIFTDRIEPLSLDEAYLDVTNNTEFNGSATRIAFEIRKMIWMERKLTASAGIAPNKLLAKIAGDWRKPNNQFTIQPHEISDFMPTLPVEKLFGVGKVTAAQLHRKGILSCGDIQKLDQGELRALFGNRGQDMYDQCRGIDAREVCSRSERKSLTVEETFSKDCQSAEELESHIPEIFAEWERRMQKDRYMDRIRGHAIKLKFSDFKSTTHESSSRIKPTLENFRSMILRTYSQHLKPVRLLGLGVRLAGGSTSELGTETAGGNSDSELKSDDPQLSMAI